MGGNKVVLLWEVIQGFVKKTMLQKCQNGRDRWAMKLSHSWRSDHSYAGVLLGFIYWNPLEDTGSITFC